MATKKATTKRAAASTPAQTEQNTAPNEQNLQTTPPAEQAGNTAPTTETKGSTPQASAGTGEKTRNVTTRKVEGPIFVVLADGVSTREYNRQKDGEHYATLAQAYHENKEGSKIIGV